MEICLSSKNLEKMQGGNAHPKLRVRSRDPHVDAGGEKFRAHVCHSKGSSSTRLQRVSSIPDYLVHFAWMSGLKNFSPTNGFSI